MRKQLTILTILFFCGIYGAQSQDSRTVRAARMSFNAAENSYKRGNYQQAAQEYEIVVNTIPASGASRRDLQMRLESLINLTDIYFYRYVNINKACDHLNTFMNDMNTIRNQGVLRSSALFQFQQKEKALQAEQMPKCANYKRLDNDMELFKQRFEEEFE